MTFALAVMIALSSFTVSNGPKFFKADAVSAATSGESNNNQNKTQTDTKKTNTTTKKTTQTKTTTQTNVKVNRLLALNSYGEDVKTLQTLLNKYGYNLKVDGIYGPKTLAAVKDFQKKHGLKAGGVVGPKTMAKLNPAPVNVAKNTTKPTTNPSTNNEVKKEKAIIKVGKVDYAAHGTKCFTFAIAAVEGDRIVAAYIDDYQFMSKDVAKGVPNSDADFGKNYPQGMVLASKMTNAEYYSQLMKDKAKSTVPIDKNFEAIIEFVKGKTIKELENILASTPKDKMADAVSGATLADTYGYITAIVEAAKAANNSPEIEVTTDELKDLKVGKVDFAAHGTKCFTLAVAFVSGDKIVASYMDDYQYMSKDVAKGVPNSDADFGKNYPQGMVLASKMTNAEYYSQLMKDKAKSTVPIDKNFEAIYKFVNGKTIKELENILASTPKDKMADAVSGATLADTYGYITAIVEAAKAAR
ncbi:peptidoglycan-binding domain-containing protein [Caloramator sp. Dgby_cultured_2]|uniref:peptidoglycan-binding domain-containing protein n=1 Tax=Caloramator sp. Dgby_cultured_2 TaxID=3029174 RepID=UPI00237DDF5D|nr:peptidoglycan-binding domain-containing protein [Caloramator sp. Dgby_cultured_2]WDU82768.1 peptidoglycan-binding domain-containing protein [Caloramator sp. Dgby_cultured_2]